MAKTGIRLPTNRQRFVGMGRTGSGKTVQGAWMLSEAPFDKQPYVIVDYKGDDLLRSLPRVQEIGLNEIPKYPGVYYVHPKPSDEDEVEAWLWRVWERERIGLYFDEAYSVPNPKGGGAFQAILTQGRSKNIPAIILTQRPSWISRFVFSEADFYAVFHLNDKRDRATIQQFMPEGTLKERLPDYHSYYYDVGRDQLTVLRPVPNDDNIRDRFDTRLRPHNKLL